MKINGVKNLYIYTETSTETRVNRFETHYPAFGQLFPGPSGATHTAAYVAMWDGTENRCDGLCSMYMYWRLDGVVGLVNKWLWNRYRLDPIVSRLMWNVDVCGDMFH